MIEHSVGRGGFNDYNDTLIIQCALNVARAPSGLPPIAIDGLVGPETIGAIVAFQRSKPGLANDGRIDAGGRTLGQLTTAIGGEEFVFGPIVQLVLAIKAELDKVAAIAPQRVKGPMFRVVPGLNAIATHGDLANGLPAAAAPVAMGFNAGAPRFGFVGVDDAMAAAALAMMALLMALFLVLLIQNPAFRKAVSVRAKELDRIMGELQINTSVGLKDAVDIVIAIASDTMEEEQKCRQSPTFQNSAECAEAMKAFAQIAAKLRALFPRLLRLLNTILNNVKFPNRGLDIRRIRVDFNGLLKEAQVLAFELQHALADMRIKCKCPDQG